MSKRKRSITLSELKSLRILRSDDPNPAVQAERHQIRARVRAELAPRIEGARRAQILAAKDLNAVVGPSPEFGCLPKDKAPR